MANRRVRSRCAGPDRRARVGNQHRAETSLEPITGSVRVRRMLCSGTSNSARLSCFSSRSPVAASMSRIRCRRRSLLALGSCPAVDSCSQRSRPAAAAVPPAAPRSDPARPLVIRSNARIGRSRLSPAPAPQLPASPGHRAVDERQPAHPLGWRRCGLDYFVP